MARKPWSLQDLELDKFDNSTACVGETVVRVFDCDVLAELKKLTADLGTDIFFDAVSLTTPNVFQTLISFTVPSLTTRKLLLLSVTCRIESYFKITLDGAQVATGQTGAANPTVTLDWKRGRPIAAGVVCNLELRSRQGSPIVDCAAHLMCADFTNP